MYGVMLMQDVQKNFARPIRPWNEKSNDQMPEGRSGAGGAP